MPESYSWDYYQHDINTDTYIRGLKRYLVEILICGLLIFTTIKYIFKNNKEWQIKFFILISLSFDVYWAIKGITEHYRLNLSVENELSTFDTLLEHYGVWAHSFYFLPLILIVLIVIILTIPHVIKFMRTDRISSDV
jgi:hypothetical protein